MRFLFPTIAIFAFSISISINANASGVSVSCDVASLRGTIQDVASCTGATTGAAPAVDAAAAPAVDAAAAPAVDAAAAPAGTRSHAVIATETQFTGEAGMLAAAAQLNICVPAQAKCETQKRVCERFIVDTQNEESVRTRAGIVDMEAACGTVASKIASANTALGNSNSLRVGGQRLGDAVRGDGGGLEGAASGIHGWMSDNPLKTAAIAGGVAGLGGYMLGRAKGDNKEQDEIDRLKKQLEEGKDSAGTSESDADCTKPGVITTQTCATHFASVCYANSSSSACGEFNAAYCNGSTSGVKNPINGSGSFYCAMVGIKAQCANSSDSGPTCMWYRQLSQTCLGNLSQLQSAACMPQYSGGTYAANCAAMPSDKLCQAPFSTILGGGSSAVVASASAGGGSASANTNSVIGASTAGIGVGASSSSTNSRDIASVDLAPIGANIFSVNSAALSGVKLVGYGQ